MSVEGLTRAANVTQVDAANRTQAPLAMLRADADLVRWVQSALVAAGYLVEYLEESALLLDRLQERPPAVFLLQINRTHSDAVTWCRALRSHAAFSKTAIILLASELDEADRVLGLEAGADVYLAMPFAGRELIAQVKAVLRSYTRRSEREYILVDDIEINVSAMSVRVAGRPVTLSLTEFRLLEFLCRNPGRAVSRDQLVQIVSKTAHAGRRAVDVYVRRLRQKIETEPSQPRHLKTVRGVGYRLSSDRKPK